MIVFFKENDEYHNVFAIYWVDEKCYFILLSKINHALFPVSSDECEVIVNDLSNYVLAFKDCSKNLIIHNLIYKNTDPEFKSKVQFFVILRFEEVRC
ncbi:hypothetical protein [Sulfurovum mangrovi]|uniref:hypothetical protein n=1 Tax=Sulfurovum mangrovi TaxID=2893889 RepID=UPI001E4491C4|nr:hypothetical protein [Sulfurovum mangrovi]UFH58037.1 hypothetical protein LN246_06690 [Sulfurovum mangrovi]